MDENENSTEDVMKDRSEENAGKQDSTLKNLIQNSRLGRAASKLKSKAKNAARRAFKNAFKTGTATVGGTIAGALIVIFILIGMVQFIISMPGIVQEGIWNKFNAGLDNFKGYLLGDNNKRFV